MKVQEFIELLQCQDTDAEVVFYNFTRGDDMYFKDISIADDNSEIYINIR